MSEEKKEASKQAPRKPLSVLLVEDDPAAARMIQSALDPQRFVCVHTGTVAEGWRYFETIRPNLVVLDVGLPDGSGLELCQKIREHPQLASTPVIILSGRNELTDKADGFGAGADQYLAKPLQIKELAFWIEALLKRIDYEERDEGILRVDDFTIDPQAHAVHVGDRSVDNLTNREFDLLYKLVQSRPKVVSKDFILKRLWKTVLRDNTINGHVKNLRAKLGPAGDRIVTVHGVGYKFQ